MGDEFWGNVLMVLIWLPIGLGIRVAGALAGAGRTDAAGHAGARSDAVNIGSMALAVLIPVMAWMGALLVVVWRLVTGNVEAGLGALTGVLLFLPLGALYVWLMGNSLGVARNSVR